MALITEDGTGLATAESYLSVTDCNAYHTANNNAAWTGADAVKEAALRKATRYLDGAYGARWPGTRKTTAQALDWPRFGAVDREDYAIDANSLPVQVKAATAELALDALAGELTQNLKRGGAIKSITLGPISKTFMDGAPGGTTRSRITLILARLLQPAGNWRQTTAGGSLGYRA